ncbi:MAG: Lrp/AsnC ligand binding domain-containing protein [Candidatus Jordarchaeum sp.]|uniref:Lrp/AsnC ligand binding domain-containing protein n=1 Tax=Candidatus Jordarchaeum sp. TaxID=2823881 RepID=UPI00404B4EC2
MVTSAYILIKTASGFEKKILSTLKEFGSIENADLVYGLYDIILKVSINSSEELDSFIFDVLRPMEGIVETMTCIIAPEK